MLLITSGCALSDEAELNEKDPLLRELPAERRDTLIARRIEEEAGTVYQFEEHM